MDIILIISQSGPDFLALIDNSVPVILQVTVSDKHNEVSVIINQSYSSIIQDPSAVNDISNTKENSCAKMGMIQSSWNFVDEIQFHAYFDVASNKESFLTMRLKKPSIHEKIEAVIVSEIATHNLGYIERHGYACAESVNERKKVTEKKWCKVLFLI